MSSFNCPVCGTPILDTPKGYVTECSHYRLMDKKVNIGAADSLMAIFGYKRVRVKKRKINKKAHP